MAWIEMLQQAINYMEDHLMDDINYEDVADMVYMSSYEFHRTFSIMAGMTANAYIRNRRLSLAGVELMETDEKVIDVALKYGYDTPESFTKAFTRFHGVSPKHAKKQGTKLCLFNPLKVKISMEGGKSMDYRMEVKEEQRFICLKRAFSNESINEEGNHEIPDFWNECHKANLVEVLRRLRPDGKKDLYGLCSPTQEGKTTFDYGIGVIVDDETKEFNQNEMELKGYHVWTTSKQQYVVFECFGENGDCINEAWIRFFKEFLPQMGYEASDHTDYEIYFENGRIGLFCELWIPVRKC